MITPGEIISLPFSVVERLPVVRRVEPLYPDREQVRRPRTYRMPPPSRDISVIYNADAGLNEAESNGRLIDVYV